jgi:hypothetical protein
MVENGSSLADDSTLNKVHAFLTDITKLGKEVEDYQSKFLV